MKKHIIGWIIVILLVSMSASATFADTQVQENDMDVKSHIVGLTEDTAVFEVNFLTDKQSSLNEITVALITAGSIVEKPLEAGDNRLEFTELKPGTEYSFMVVNKTLKSIVETINFRTFTGSKDMELHYFVDARNGKTKQVDVTIFGNYKNTDGYDFRADWGHAPGDALRIVDGSLDVQVDGDYNFDKTYNALGLRFNSKQGNFRVSYKSDKSFYGLVKNGINEDVSFGMFKDKYLLATGEYVLLNPDNQIDYSGTMISMITPKDWVSDVGLDKAGLNNLYVDKLGQVDFLYTHLYAYHPNDFDIARKEIYGTDITVAVEKGIEYDYASAFFTVYEKQCELWGDSANKDKYSLLVFKDNRDVNVGEYSYGQAVPNYHTINTIAHQSYHIWNGWIYMIPWEWDHDDYDWGFWSDGFNEYYNYRILDSMGIEEGQDRMTGVYREYKEGIRNGTDVNVLDEGMHRYSKGAVVAYALNKEIHDRTEGEYSLDDVLKALYASWIEDEQSLSYDKLVECINGFVTDGVDDWWQFYVVENNELYLNELQ